MARSLAIACLAVTMSLASATPASSQVPKAWGFVGGGLGIPWGDSTYNGGPNPGWRAGLAVRVAPEWAVELEGLQSFLAQSAKRAPDLIDLPPGPPCPVEPRGVLNLAGASLGLAHVWGTADRPTDALLSAGAGAYQLEIDHRPWMNALAVYLGGEKTVIASPRAALTIWARIVVLPNAQKAVIWNVPIGVALRAFCIGSRCGR